MKLRSPSAVRLAIGVELDAARHGDSDGWRHLERAHVLSQAWVVDHVGVHAAMLRRAWRDRDRTEVWGQLLRLVVAGPGSLSGRYPMGNTGRARVPATAPMPITDDDIVAILAAAGPTRHPAVGAGASAADTDVPPTPASPPPGRHEA